MRREDFDTVPAFAEYIARLELSYAERLFYALYKNAGNIQAWYNEPNKVAGAWKGKMVPSPDASEAWDQVGEIVTAGVVTREFPEWFPVGLPIGSEIRLESPDAVIHIDVKTHKDWDSDLDRTQDVRPEQISSDEDDSFVIDLKGRLGDCPPRLPPYYDLGPNLLKVTITGFIIFVYVFEPESGYQFLKRMQLMLVPNGVLRACADYRDCFRPGKDGREQHRYRVILPALSSHEQWRWREILFEAHGFTVTR